MDQRIDLVIVGYVQGVGYRAFCRRTASALGLKGYVKNRFDGTVEVCAVGEKRRLELFLRQLRQGPSRADVERIDIRWSEPSGDEPGSFTVRR